MATSKCAACAKRVRKTQRAIVLTGPGTLSPGKVCGACARTGWLLVLGGEPALPPTKKRAVRARSALAQHILDGGE